MYNGLMDPELMRIAQEQMGRIPPDELMKMQQQMFSNPELIKMATERMQNLKPEDIRFAAEQMKNVRKEDLEEIRERMSRASPEEIAGMRAQADAQFAYQLQGAQNLKSQGNQLHALGKYGEAAEKYLQAKNNLTGLADPKAKSLILACSLNLMSCYLKTRQYDDCIQTGSEVLAYDSRNVKALYRRGQAYKEIGKLELAVADLSKAVEVSPNDETIAQVLRETKGELTKEDGSEYLNSGPKIEEITEEEAVHITAKSETEAPKSIPSKSSVREHDNVPEQVSEKRNEVSRDQFHANNAPPEDTYDETLRNLSENPDMIRNMQTLMSNASPESLAALSGGKMSPEMVKTASEMFSRMSPDELQNMIKMTTMFHSPNQASTSTFDRMNRRPSTTGSQRPQANAEDDIISERTENNIMNSFVGLNSGAAFSGMPNLSTDVQEQMKNQMKDPAMRQVFTTMMKNMSPEMMANMGEQFGLKLSHDDAVRAQNAMASLSPDDLDRLMNWATRLQRVMDSVRNIKNWVLGKPGLIFAFVMLVLAIILHRLGYIGD